MNQMTDELAVRKSVFVRCTPEHAFTVFTERIGDWWPFDGHSLFDDKAEAVVFEGHVGGRVYERSAEGEEGLWGTMTVWDPPNGFTMTWHPGRGEETAQELELRFSPKAAERGSTSCTQGGSASATGWPRSADTTTRAGTWSSGGSPRPPGRRAEMNPDVARQLAADRQADLLRESRASGQARGRGEAPAWRARRATPERRPARAPVRSPRARGRPSAQRRPGAGRS